MKHKIDWRQHSVRKILCCAYLIPTEGMDKDLFDFCLDRESRDIFPGFLKSGIFQELESERIVLTERGRNLCKKVLHPRMADCRGFLYTLWERMETFGKRELVKQAVTSFFIAAKELPDLNETYVERLTKIYRSVPEKVVECIVRTHNWDFLIECLDRAIFLAECTEAAHAKIQSYWETELPCTLEHLRIFRAMREVYQVAKAGGGLPKENQDLISNLIDRLEDAEKHRKEVLKKRKESPPDNIFVLHDEDGNAHQFELIDVIRRDGNEYVVFVEGGDAEEVEIVIMQVEEIEELDEVLFQKVNDESVLLEMYRGIREKFKDRFLFTD